MASEVTIARLPHHSIDAVLEFYRALQFEIRTRDSKDAEPVAASDVVAKVRAMLS